MITQTGSSICANVKAHTQTHLALACRFWMVNFTVTRMPFHWLVPLTISSGASQECSEWRGVISGLAQQH